MDSFTQRLRHWPKEDLLTEVKHIQNKDPSSYNWTASARKAILAELKRRKANGTLGAQAGVRKRNAPKSMFGGFSFW